ncbi:MAG: ubiquinone/menaquinone biosynthesis methyltransferase, partial [Acidobacteriota bacterium]
MTAVNTAKRAAHSQAVREMFAGIAGRYDLLNHVLSANIDRRWRRLVRLKMADVLADPSAVVADIACGTGDLSIELAGSASAAILGADFCRPMLSLAKEKSAAASFAIPFIEADAMSLPFADNAFDAVTIAFGLRNLSDVPDGLAELHRILKPGGRLVVLEFSTPVVPGFKGLFDFYFNRILPRIGGV